MGRTPSTLIQPGSVPMTSSARKESKPRRDSVFFSLKLNNPNTDFISTLYLSTFIQSSSHKPLQTFFELFLQLISYINQNKKQLMNTHFHNLERDLSTSQDHCRCEACRNQDEIKNYQRPNPTNIYVHKHLKKRGVPPIKKELFNKDLSHKSKYITKKEQLEKKLQPQKTSAIPTKHKLIQVLRLKQSSMSPMFPDYHPVSHSQRQKLPSKDGTASKLEESRRVINQEDSKGLALNKQFKPRAGFTKLVQISENPENIRQRFQHERSVSQASATLQDEQNKDSIKSLQKLRG